MRGSVTEEENIWQPVTPRGTHAQKRRLEQRLRRRTLGFGSAIRVLEQACTRHVALSERAARNPARGIRFSLGLLGREGTAETINFHDY